MGEEIQAVCDRCRLKQSFDDAAAAVAFLRAHAKHNFTGARVVEVDNPCPNRARHYTHATNAPVVGLRLGLGPHAAGTRATRPAAAVPTATSSWPLNLRKASWSVGDRKRNVTRTVHPQR